jgi:branched-chain amino acid transport system permease protein
MARVSTRVSMGQVRAGIILVLLVAALLVPVTSAYYVFVGTFTLLNVAAAYGLLLPLKTGVVSLASAAFIGIGAYTTAVMRLEYQLNLALALVLSILAAGVAAGALGVLLVRTRGAYFIMMTFAFTVLVGLILNSDIEMLGGPGGLYGFAGSRSLGIDALSKTTTYYLVLAVCVGAGALLYAAQRSPLEDIWASIRNQELLASSLGVNVRPYSALAFIAGAMIQGAVGCMWAMFYGAIDPTGFTFWLSVSILVYCIVGGSSSNIVGVTVAAVVLSVLPQVLADTPNLYRTSYGLLIAGVVLAQVLPVRATVLALARRLRPAGQPLVGRDA